MLTAKFYLLKNVPGYGNNPSQITGGVVIAEDDATLPYQRVAGVVDWGDGTDPYTITPGVSPYQSSSTVQIVQSGANSVLTIDPLPYTGSFKLVYSGTTSTPDIEYNAAASAIQIALDSVLDTGESVEVTGVSPQWILSFDSPITAAKITVGVNFVWSPVSLPTHLYARGNFTIKLEARNFRSPTPDSYVNSYALSLGNDANLIRVSPILMGPILAADSGFPNTDQWNFNISTDLKVLVSNVKMVLIVEPGERVMMPEYGTALRQFIFDPMLSGIEQDVETEVRRAVNTWEPRVLLDSVGVVKREPRVISLSVTGVSQLNKERFQFNIELER
jgi:phage baseplate assembly protein W